MTAVFPVRRPDGNDTLQVWRAIARNRWLVLPVVLITVVAVGWLLVLRPPTYQVRSSLLLVPPPPAPTAAQIEDDPALADLNADNPYGRAYDPTILIAVITSAVTSEAGRAEVERAGGDDGYLLVQSRQYGVDSPFVEITTFGPSPDATVRSNMLVVSAFQAELAAVQQAADVSEEYWVTARLAVDPADAEVRPVDVGRGLIAIVILGILGVFTAVSVADAVRQSGRDRREPLPSPEPSGSAAGGGA